MGNATLQIGATVPRDLVVASKEFAKVRGMTFSELVKIALAKEIGYAGNLFVQNGGDRSSSKSKLTHERVCEKMRAAKMEKRRAVLAKARKRLDAEQEALVLRAKEMLSGKARDERERDGAGETGSA